MALEVKSHIIPLSEARREVEIANAVSRGLPRQLVEAVPSAEIIGQVLALDNPVGTSEQRFATAASLQQVQKSEVGVANLLLYLTLSDRFPDPTRLAAAVALQGVTDPLVSNDLSLALSGNLAGVLSRRLGLPEENPDLIIDPFAPPCPTVKNLLADAQAVANLRSLAVWALKLQTVETVILDLEDKLQPDLLLTPDADLTEAVNSAKVLADCAHTSVGPAFARCIDGCSITADPNDPKLNLLRSIFELFSEARGGFRPAGAELYRALVRARVRGFTDETLHNLATQALGAREIRTFDLVELKVTTAAHTALERVIAGTASQIAETI